jgi:GTP cyclohydrolase II
VKRHLIALAGALGILLTAGTGVAAAQSVQGVEQFAGTGQSASSNASSTQTNPSNSNISVRIFSPGDAGSVTQENTSAAESVAANDADTTQTADQSQSGGGGEQAVGQEAFTGQEADADAESKQINPSNSNVSVRIHSPGDDGDVSQSNSSDAKAIAHNESDTDQAAEQEQDKGKGKDGCCSGAGVQAIGQKAETWQDADADAKSVQYNPSNSNIAVRIHSPGDNGDVSQTNSSEAKAIADNEADTTQKAEQEQEGGCKCGSDLVQAVGQKAITDQEADADATSIQKGAKNLNVPVRIFSPGDDGDVEQTNSSDAFAGAFNDAETKQIVEQEQEDGCKCDRHAFVQAVGQWAETWQDADADATSVQEKPSNKNVPVRIKSRGDGGQVEQTNASLAAALSLNRAFTFQKADQDQ